ncbi:MAG TPA: type II CAAX endopeptidase family protein [Acidobacteriaceae bacterium]|nr:type II CAAX endopeptidase family protein [Acidobacteriaceae bacterium]
MSKIGIPEPTVEDALDIQHDPFPADDHGIAKRIPHLGHVALFLAMLAFSLLVSVALFRVVLHGHPQLRENSLVELASEAVIYILTLILSFKIFPLLWKRPFLDGIEFNTLAVRRNWGRLLGGGIALCLFSECMERFFTPPKSTDLDKILSTQSGAWAALLLGVFLAPLFEEIVFRGFLLPAFATAYDWLSLDRSPAGLERWRNSTAHTTPAKVFGALLSSVLFGLLHAPQLHYAWGAVFVILCVGLVLAFVRLRLHSLACSTLVHMTYNGTLFAFMLIWTHGFRHLDRLQS